LTTVSQEDFENEAVSAVHGSDLTNPALYETVCHHFLISLNPSEDHNIIRLERPRKIIEPFSPSRRMCSALYIVRDRYFTNFCLNPWWRVQNLSRRSFSH